MKQKTKRPQIIFRMEEHLIRKLDKRIARAGYTSRSDFFTAVAYVALYGDKTENQPQKDGDTENREKLPEQVSSWVKTALPYLTEEEIQTGLHRIIKSMLYPVIAMKGVELAYENTWADVRSAFHHQHKVWVTESDLREAYTAFAAIHKKDLDQYRENQLTNNDTQP